MWAWPNLVLTDYERKFVSMYKTKDKPGVLRRTYRVTLNSPEQEDSNLPVTKLSDQVQIARRSRVFGLTFSGNLDMWRLQITNASGTLYTVKTPRTQLDPVVTSLVPSSGYNSLSLGGLAPPLAPGNTSPGIGPNAGPNGDRLATQQAAPLIIDPNWLLLPNETLIFNGTPLPVDYEQVTPDLVLIVGIHVWEFPVMGTAPADEREVI